jgi:hypothetical protein
VVAFSGRKFADRILQIRQTSRTSGREILLKNDSEIER